jgi:hypothetical protein
MFELVALYGVSPRPANPDAGVFEIVWGREDDLKRATQVARRVARLGAPAFRPLRIRIRPLTPFAHRVWCAIRAKRV